MFQVMLENSVKCWNFSSSRCVQATAKNTEDYRERANLGPLHKAKSACPSNWFTEDDISPELASAKASCCQSLISLLQWIVVLGRGH